MAPEMRLLIGLAASAAVVFMLTPVAARLAGRFDLLDHPRGYRTHDVATPYLGGLALMAGFVATTLALAGDLDRTLPVLAGVAMLAVVGTLDDRNELSVALRILAAVVGAAGLWATDLGWDLGEGAALDLVATIVWVVAVVNAFNLFDNMDGASSAMGFVTAGAAAVFGVADGDLWLTAAGAALAGACLGFLPHNLARPNARIFLGDGGSLPLGFAIAALVMTAAGRSVQEWEGLAIGFLLVGVPAVDTALVVFSRARRGVSILTGGRDHLTHRTSTRTQFGDARLVVSLLGGLQLVLAALSLFAVEGGTFAIVVLMLVFLAFAAALITVLEVGDDALGAGAGAGAGDEQRRRPRAAPSWLPRIPPLGTTTVAALGFAVGITPFFLGLYDASVWVPAGLVAVALAGTSALGHPPRLSTPAWMALGGLLGLGLWALLSTTWAGAVEPARVDANRLLVLAAVLASALSLVGSDRLARILGLGIGAGILTVALWVLVRMLGSDPTSLFVDGRLHEPLEYINAEATVFLMGAWLAIAAAERRGPRTAGACAAIAVVFLGLLVLSQSRGGALAALGSLAVVMLLVPGRLRRVCTLAVVGAGLLVALGPLLAIADAVDARGRMPEDVVRDAALALTLAAVVTGAAWAGAVLLYDRRSWSEDVVVRARHLGGIVLIVAVVFSGVTALAMSGRIVDAVDRQYDAFVDVGGPDAGSAAAGSRLTSGAGNRYDYWRVALNTFADAPIRGVGAGNWNRDYFQHRRTDEDVRQPHSFVLQTAAELGLVGLLLLSLFVGGLLAAAIHLGRVARDDPGAQLVAVGTIGAVSAWLIHSSVDWVHLVPGTSAIALLLAGALLRRRSSVAVVAPRRPAAVRRHVAATGLLACVVALSAATLARQGLSELHRDRAFEALPDDPGRALVEANRALRIDPDGIESYYAKAAALAQTGSGAAADTVLLAALARDPGNYVTLALLGDVAVRRGRLVDARARYAVALELNPRDPQLQRLAADPSAALADPTR